MRRFVVAAMLLLAGCSGSSKDASGFEHFTPNSKAMIVSDDGSNVTGNVEGGTGLDSWAFLRPGTEVLIESDDRETSNMTFNGAKKPRRFVDVVVLDGQYKGIRCSVDFTDLRAVPK